jgi:hypothetical protein
LTRSWREVSIWKLIELLEWVETETEGHALADRSRQGLGDEVEEGKVRSDLGFTWHSINEKEVFGLVRSLERSGEGDARRIETEEELGEETVQISKRRVKEKETDESLNVTFNDRPNSLINRLPETKQTGQDLIDPLSLLDFVGGFSQTTRGLLGGLGSDASGVKRNAVGLL